MGPSLGTFSHIPLPPTVPIRAPNSFNNKKASKNFLSVLVVVRPENPARNFGNVLHLKFFFSSHIQHGNKIKKLGQFLCSVTPLRVGESSGCKKPPRLHLSRGTSLQNSPPGRGYST